MTAIPRTIYLFVNGDLPAPKRLRAAITPQDILIAVDGGLRHISALNLTPHLIIGDLDSADPQLVDHYEKEGVEVRRFAAQKDETDLELALTAAREWRPSAIRIVAALGDRLDHTLGNIFLLTQPDLSDLDVRLVDGEQEVWLIRSAAEVHGSPGDQVSLIPLNGPVTGIRTTGLSYPLHNETLYPDQTRGISNQLAANTASISIESGCLLCVHMTITTSGERTLP